MRRHSVYQSIFKITFFFFKQIISSCFQTASGNVEAKVLCYCRRRDLPVSLLKIADRAERIDKVVNTRRRLAIAPVIHTRERNGDSSSDTPKKGLLVCAVTCLLAVIQ
ncbi:unnamed protein product [Gongylonema pulchrum]|uniref:Secreted protein n=1 Tax=Gongylonema pulchrum TaxID=637853 RepID=A0A183DN97_9BILA|nr:unnamed protein product [Gongylonema pulchrum]